jgi:hypothetical protein
MLRLAHRILDQAARNHPVHTDDTITKEVADQHVRDSVDLIRTAPVIIADNVLEYYQSLTQRHSCVNLAPPFDHCFIEAQEPSTKGNIHQLGWIIIAAEAESERASHLPQHLQKMKDWTWALVITPIACYRDMTLSFPVDKFYITVAANGSFIESGMGGGMLATGGGKEEDSDQFFQEHTAVPLMTINFMNCRNVVLDDVTQEKGPTKKWLRQRQHPTVKYQIAVIDPMKATKQLAHKPSDHIGGHDKSQQRFHIRRGRFTTYTDANGSKGLFGKGIYGTFWVPSHTVGDKKNGQTITTYHVKAPND